MTMDTERYSTFQLMVTLSNRDYTSLVQYITMRLYFTMNITICMVS